MINAKPLAYRVLQLLLYDVERVLLEVRHGCNAGGFAPELLRRPCRVGQTRLYSSYCYVLSDLSELCVCLSPASRVACCGVGVRVLCPP